MEDHRKLTSPRTPDTSDAAPQARISHSTRQTPIFSTLLKTRAVTGTVLIATQQVKECAEMFIEADRLIRT